MWFSKVFYLQLIDRLRDEGGGSSSTVDLARAMQMAVLTLRNDINSKFQKSYHWAGFVLHSLWLLLNGGSFLSLHENVLANAGTLHG